MVVPDTSIWIEFLKQNADITHRFLSLLETRQVAVIEPVFSELVYGVRKSRDKELVLAYWQLLPKLRFDSGSMLEAARFANDHKYFARGVGLMDAVILLPVLNQGYQLWTLDKRILRILDTQNRFK